MLQQQIDILLAWAAADYDELVAAKAEYFGQTGGEVHEDDRSFEARMQGFFNWYLFDRKGAAGVTPVQRYLSERGAQIGGTDKELLTGATESRLSLFEYKGRATLLRRVPDGQVRVRDAFSGEDFDVIERRQMHGLDVGDFFEARLIPISGGKYHFSTSFLYYPREVKRTIQREIKKRRKNGTLPDPRGFCFELQKMALQHERFRNVSIDAIYNFETPFLGHKKKATSAEEVGHG